MTKTPHFRHNSDRRTILVTGASGRLGRLLRGAVHSGGSDGADIRFADRSGTTDLQLDADALPAQLPPVDMVVGLWGVTSGTEDELAGNAALVAATHAVARAADAPRSLHLSSAAIYGPAHDATEDDAPTPVNDYGRAKLEMEARVAALPDDGIAHTCLRLSNVVGADSLAHALRGTSGTAQLTRFEDGRGPLRSYTPPGLLLRIFQALSALPPSDLPATLNVASADPVEMEDLLRAAGTPYTRKDPPPGDRQHVTLSTARLQGLLPGLALSMSADEMIRDWRAAEAHA